jgi:hypothetical protein
LLAGRFHGRPANNVNFKGVDVFVERSKLNDSSANATVLFNVEPEVAYADKLNLLADHIMVASGDSRVHRFGLANVVSVESKKDLYMPQFILGPMTKLEFKDLRQGMENIVVVSERDGMTLEQRITEAIVSIDNGDTTFRTDNSGWIHCSGKQIFQQHYWVAQAVQGNHVDTPLVLEDAKHGEIVLHVELASNQLIKRFFVFNTVSPSVVQMTRLLSSVEQSFTHGMYRLYPSVDLPVRALADIPGMPGSEPDVQPAPGEPEPADGKELGESPVGGIPPMPGDVPGFDRPDNPDWWTGKDK